MADGRAIQRSVLGDQVKERLLEAILSGRYPPDSRIVETQVARELGTSQAPVREALRGLEALGVVEISPFRGARVRRPTAAELDEAYAVRSTLETLGARLAMPRMTDADLADLVARYEDMRRAAAAGDAHAVAMADAGFHARLLRLAGNATLERVWQSLEPYSRTYITLFVPGAHPDWTANLHTGIVEALRARDTEAVVAALERHFEEAADRLARQWDEAAIAQPAVPRGAVRKLRRPRRAAGGGNGRKVPAARRRTPG